MTQSTVEIALLAAGGFTLLYLASEDGHRLPGQKENEPSAFNGIVLTVAVTVLAGVLTTRVEKAIEQGEKNKQRLSSLEARIEEEADV